RSSAYWQSGAWYRGVREFSTHDGIPGRVLDTEFPYLTAEYASDAYADPALSAQALVQHAIAVPIKDNTGAVIGFFELHRAPGRPAFTWNDAAFLESLADTTAMAIENARLVTELALRNYEIRRELHDEAGQALVGVKLALQTLSRVVPDGLQTIRSPLDELRQQVNQATARLRQLARRLRPPALDQHGLPSALSQLVHDTEERAGLEVALDLRWLPDRRSPVLETALFRITQEALTNIVAHANARRVSIQLGECSGSMWLQITDDGRGFQTGTETGGLGLRGIAERVHVLGGDFQLHSAPAEGTRLCVRLPVG
ncbi:MAG: GAF domain-containing sensor histidine kinase, partial [Gemmatimonadaceae bacterium]|nr:GAF domain-containing sensor histidine kinase [Gemmatimonadaceae bacterium]